MIKYDYRRMCAMLNKRILKSKMLLIAFVCILLPLMADGAAAEEGKKASGVNPTPFSMDLYGSIEGAEEGDIVQVYDPDEVLCGEFIINKAGQYGFVHVYGDDPGTAVDEGAGQGDELRFEFSGERVYPSSGDDLLWTGDRNRERVDF